MKYFKEEFYKLLNLVKTRQPFAFSRFSDGERTIMKNAKLVLSESYFIQGDMYGDQPIRAPFPYMEEERKDFNPEEDSFYRDKLIEAYKYKKNNYFKGISGYAEWNGNNDFQECLDLYGPDDHEHLTFSNVLINGNYKNFIEEMVAHFSGRKVILVCNKNANFDKLPFDVYADFRIGSNCMKNDYHLIKEMKEYIKKEKLENCLFLFSAASLSNFLIYELYKDFDKNQYVDIGSALSPLMNLQGWRGTRVYLRCYWEGEQNPIINQEDVWN